MHTTATSQMRNGVQVRTACVDDIQAIEALVDTCGPYLSKHQPYVYLIYCRCFKDTCLVAFDEGRLIGWLSVLPVSQGRYFLHQLGIAPEARIRGVALTMFGFLLTVLKARHSDDFRIEFTLDARNRAVQRLNQRVAEYFDLCLQKLVEPVPVLEEDSQEELWELTPWQLMTDVRVGVKGTGVNQISSK